MITYELSIRGPLFDMLNRYQHLKIETAMRASLIEPANIIRRNPRYYDISPYIAVVMSEEEILAEKVVALMFRHNVKPRDLFDLYFLINKGIGINVSLTDKKMREYGHTFTQDQLIRRLDETSKIWDSGLNRLISVHDRVRYPAARDLVIQSFRDAGLI